VVRNQPVPPFSSNGPVGLVTGTPYRGVYQSYQFPGWYGFKNVPVRTSRNGNP
jgi:hypothetical protein